MLAARVGAPEVNAALIQDTLSKSSMLRAQTTEAMERGIFGAPSFLIGDEIFWGFDRLDAAISWAQNTGV